MVDDSAREGGHLGLSRLQLAIDGQDVKDLRWVMCSDDVSDLGRLLGKTHTHDGSMVLPYMVTWIPSIYQ
jgi:hypothetical protein